MGFTPRGRLSPDQLDSLEEWARVLIDDDDEDSGNQLLMLLREREELATLVLRDQDGKLRTLVETQLRLEQVQKDFDRAREDLRGATTHAENYRQENVELKRQLEGFAELLHKVEKLLAMARDRVQQGEAPSDLARVAQRTIDQEGKKEPRLLLEPRAKTTKVGT